MWRSNTLFRHRKVLAFKLKNLQGPFWKAYGWMCLRISIENGASWLKR